LEIGGSLLDPPAGRQGLKIGDWRLKISDFEYRISNIQYRMMKCCSADNNYCLDRITAPSNKLFLSFYLDIKGPKDQD
jgi:hypothetical protein